MEEVQENTRMQAENEVEKQQKEIQERLGRIRHKLLVMSGKGGVGKSSVAAYLAVILARRGYRVGLMDVDLHGPSIPRLIGLEGGIQPAEDQDKVRPVSAMPNLEVISIESLMGDAKDVATIWRGPMKIGIIKQFISDIEWSPLDYLVLDSPPGTGDEPLTVAQTIPDAHALIVTTPQEISLADIRKSIHFCRQVHMEVLGLVENMSGLTCPHCGRTIDLFKAHGAEAVAEKAGLRVLATLPLEPELVKQGDVGDTSFLDNAELPVTRELESMADEVLKQTGEATTGAPQGG